MTFYKSLNVAESSSLLANGLRVEVGMMYWPDASANTKESDYWYNTGDGLEWVAETSTPSGGGGGGGSNNDGATMLAQGLAAGAALIAAFSF